MGDEATQERQGSLAAPFVFLIVASLQFAYYWLDHLKKVRDLLFTILIIIGMKPMLAIAIMLINSGMSYHLSTEIFHDERLKN